jgi:hypothetical protein
MLDMLDLELDFEVKRLVVSHRGKTTYHYWRTTPNLNKKGFYYVRICDSHFVLREGRIIHSWDKCCDAIDEQLIVEKRDRIIRRILNERS